MFKFPSSFACFSVLLIRLFKNVSTWNVSVIKFLILPLRSVPYSCFGSLEILSVVQGFLQKSSLIINILIFVKRNLWHIKLSRLIGSVLLRLIFMAIVAEACPASKVRNIYVELRPFVVNSMSWFNVWANQITGNYISSSSCGPD